MLKSVAAFVVATLFSTIALAQQWPEKPVYFIVPFAAGGATDLAARVLGEKLSAVWKQSVVVENRTGAGGAIGASEAARAAPDGYTLFFPSGSVLTANQHIYAHLSYDPDKDFIPVTKVVSSPQVLVVNAKSPYKTVSDLIAAARKHPAKLTFGHAGVGSQTDLAGESFSLAAKIDVVPVPYKGDPPALNDLLGGRLTYCVTTLSSAIPHVKSGKLRALGVTSSGPVPQLPGVPPMARQCPASAISDGSGSLHRRGHPRLSSRRSTRIRRRFSMTRRSQPVSPHSA
jgi:tripartite-type tricarboxylate transporter receptor subunit TctC